MLALLLVFLLVAFIFGGWSGYRGYGYVSWSPFGILLVVVLLWFLLGGHL